MKYNHKNKHKINVTVTRLSFHIKLLIPTETH